MGWKNFHTRLRRTLRVGYSSEEKQDDTNFYRCKVCGHVCDSKKVAVAGNRASASTFLSGVDYPTDSDGDYYPDVSRGCPKCGTMYSR